MKKNSCTYDCLASTEYGQILVCRDCQVIHLQVQNMTLRFNVKVFLGIADTLASATKTLNAFGIGQKKTPQHKLTLIK